MGDIESFKSQINILDVIGEVVELKRFKGLCPFHREKTSSFTVTPNRGMWKCFGCGLGGDVISFVKEFHRIEFVDAVKFLADKFNLESPLDNSEEARKRTFKRKTLLELIEDVAKIYSREFNMTPRVRDYMFNRGFTEDTLNRWQIGYAPAEWEFLINRLGNPAKLKEIGVVGWTESRGGKYFDYFRNRIIFPIRDAQGKLISFAGRTLDPAEKVKYLNTPETILYKKRNVLFGLEEALQDQRLTRDRSVIVVEGYTDKIMASQFGLRNVVALCGTALTIEQARLLGNYFDEVYVALDPDAAGRNKTPDAVKEILHFDVKARVVQLPGGKDLDELLIAEGTQPVEKAVSEAVHLYEFVLNKAVEGKDLSNPDDQHAALKETLPFLKHVGDFARQHIYLKKTSEVLGLNYNIVRVALAEFDDYGGLRSSEDVKRGINSDPLDFSSNVIHRASEQEEFEALLLMLRRSDYLPYLSEHLSEEHFTNPVYRAVFNYLKDAHGERNVLFEDMLMSVEAMPMFDDKPDLADEVYNFCKDKNIEIERGRLERFCMMVRHASAGNLTPELVYGKINRAKIGRELLDMEGRILSERDPTKTITMLRDYHKRYIEFNGPLA